MTGAELMLLGLGMVVGNLLFVALSQRSAAPVSLARAIERSIYQVFALFGVWLCLYLKAHR